MTVATYNAASIRARLPLVCAWLAEHEPDVLALQETKVEDEKFPLAAFEELGYEVALNGQKSWNGVATLSRTPPRDVRRGFEDELFPNDARIISCEIGGVRILNTYVPNGTAIGSDKFEYKLRWLDRFAEYLRAHHRPDEPLIWLGDVNIAPRPEDVWDSKRFLGGVGHHPEEFRRLEKIVEFGLVDLFVAREPGPGHYTYWEFTIPKSVERNLGWRIDHIYATRALAERCVSVHVDREARRAERPSDHTFVAATFDL